MLDSNGACLNGESDGSIAALAVLVPFWSEPFEKITEFSGVKISGQGRLVDRVVRGVLELRRFGAAFVPFSTVTDTYLAYSRGAQGIRECEHFGFSFLFLGHDGAS